MPKLGTMTPRVALISAIIARNYTDADEKTVVKVAWFLCKTGAMHEKRMSGRKKRAARWQYLEADAFLRGPAGIAGLGVIEVDQGQNGARWPTLFLTIEGEEAPGSFGGWGLFTDGCGVTDPDMPEVEIEPLPVTAPKAVAVAVVASVPAPAPKAAPVARPAPIKPQIRGGAAVGPTVQPPAGVSAEEWERSLAEIAEFERAGAGGKPGKR